MKCGVFGVILLIGICQAEIPAEVPDLDDFEAIKERCEKKGGAGTYEKLKTAGEQAQSCIKDIIDVDKIKTEVEEAKKTGSMDEVFGKYCGKRPQIRECVKKVYDAVQPCLEENEKNALNVTGNIVRQISDFACYRDGDRIAMFVAEKGVECLNSRVESIKSCVNQTLKFNPATFSPNSIPNLTIDKKKCDDLTTIQNCIVKDLEDHCSSTTPANVIDALFRFVKKTACKEAKTKRSISLKRAVRNVMTITQDQFRESLEHKMKATCQKNGGDGAFENLETSFNNSRACFMKHRIFGTPSNIYQSNLSNCTNDYRNALKNCLAEGEKYFADFILELIQSLYGFIYKNYGKIMAGGQPSAELTSCMRTLSNDEVQKKLYSCSNTTLNELTITNNIITLPPKSQICESLTEVSTCISKTIKNTCIRDITISQLADDFVETMTAPCQNKRR
uniref:Hemolymph protein n=1 Tax=Anoplophora glabripennis TaxID=217634 RepID=V5GLV5_ANOGL